MTRIVRITKTGGPEVLKLETINLDQPNPDEVLIHLEHIHRKEIILQKIW